MLKWLYPNKIVFRLIELGAKLQRMKDMQPVKKKKKDRVSSGKEGHLFGRGESSSPHTYPPSRNLRRRDGPPLLDFAKQDDVSTHPKWHYQTRNKLPSPEDIHARERQWRWRYGPAAQLPKERTFGYVWKEGGYRLEDVREHQRREIPYLKV